MKKLLLFGFLLSACATAPLGAESLDAALDAGNYSSYKGELDLCNRGIDSLHWWENLKKDEFRWVKSIDLSDNSISDLPNDFVRWIANRGIDVNLRDNYLEAGQLHQIFSSAGSKFKCFFKF